MFGKKRAIPAVFIIILAFSTCFSDWEGDAATITINLGAGTNARAADYPPTDENGIFLQLEHRITLQGPTGTLDKTFSNGETKAAFTVVPGLWEITVEAWLDNALYATGSASVNIKAGQSNAVDIEMRQYDDGGNGSAGGKLTIIGVPAVYNGKYVCAAGYAEGQETFGFLAASSINGSQITCGQIVNGSVTLDVWKLENLEELQGISVYTGNDNNVPFMVLIFDAAILNVDDEPQPVAMGEVVISFTNGVASVPFSGITIDPDPNPDLYFSIHWDLDGGMTVMDYPTQIKTGEVLARPFPDPIKTGCIFAGWYADSTLTILYDFTSPVTANLTLYAKWLEQAGYIPVTSITLSPNSLELTIGQTGTLTVTVEPFNASNPALTWESSDTNVAAVSSAGTVTGSSATVTVNGRSAGTATITVSAVDGKTAYCTVTVDSGGDLPASPTGVTAMATATSITVQWNPVAGAIGYRIFYSTTSTGIYTQIPEYPEYLTATSYTHTGLTTGATYYYRVAAVNNSGQGMQSAAVQATAGGSTGFGTEANPIPLSADTWVNGSITPSDSAVWYSFSVISGTYYVWWNDSYEGDGSKTLDVRVNAFYSNNEDSILLVITDKDSGWNSPQLLIVNSSGTVKIKVEPYASGSTGTFAIAYSTSDTRPGSGGTPGIYKITYNANGGAGTILDQEVTVTAGSPITVNLSNGNGFTKDGYVFSGWNTTADGTGINYYAEASYTFTGDLTLYAIWKEG